MMPNWENPVELETQDTRRGVCHIETPGGVDVKNLKDVKAQLLAMTLPPKNVLLS